MPDRARQSEGGESMHSNAVLGCLICLLVPGAAGCEQAVAPRPLPPGTRMGYYVASNGTLSGDGTSAKPWDLQTALSGGKGRVQPGDTIWLRDGTYRGAFHTELTGPAAASILVRQYPGGRAVLDGRGRASSTTR